MAVIFTFFIVNFLTFPEVASKALGDIRHCGYRSSKIQTALSSRGSLRAEG
jgi:hypothetical protein